MRDRDIIEKIRDLVHNACREENNAFGYSIWTHHIVNVVKYGRLLAERWNADTEIVEIAALLHDYAAIKDKSMYTDHHINSSVEAEKILEEYGYPAEKISAVKHCIVSHRGSVKIENETIEAVCLINADAMTHIDQVPSLLHLVFVQFGMSVDEGVQWVLDKLTRSWNKLTDEGKELIGEKYRIAIDFLKTGQSG